MKRIALLIEKSREYGRELIRGIANYAQQHGDWTMCILSPNDLKRQDALDGFDGLITRSTDKATLRRLRHCRIPIVDAYSSTPCREMIGIDSNHQAIARMAAEFFLRRGFRHYAFCGFRTTRFSDERRDWFRHTLREHGYEMIEYMIDEPPSDDALFDERTAPPAAMKSLRDWIAALPSETALFCANDQRAYQVSTIANDLGRSIPEDLALLGVDNDTLICSFSQPPLSSIDPNAAGVGYAAARLLNVAIEHPEPHKQRPVFNVNPRELTERTSTRHYPVDPPWLSNLLTLIHCNYAKRLYPADIIAASGKSHPIVEKAFRQNFGKTIGRYLADVRLDEANRLLAEGNHSCREIAALTGFSTPQYFSECYRRHFGHSPRSTFSETVNAAHNQPHPSKHQKRAATFR